MSVLGSQCIPPSPNDEENLDTLEFYVGFLKERCDNFLKEDHPDRHALNDFMADYIDLEDKILKQIEKSTVSEEDERMNTLVATFSKYFGEFQDQWPGEWWEVYKLYSSIENKELITQLNKKTLTISESSFNEGNKNKEIKLNSSLNTGTKKLKDIKKLGNTNDDTANLTTVNLNKIDEELEKVDDSSSIIPEKKDEKRRSCLECVIY